jgi:hypothetical protein
LATVTRRRLPTSNGGTTWGAQTSGTATFLFGVDFIERAVAAVPEPASILLLGTGLAALVARRQRPVRRED